MKLTIKNYLIIGLSGILLLTVAVGLVGINSINAIQYEYNYLIAIVIVSIIAGIALSLFLLKAIITPILDITSRVQCIAEGEGDLTKRLDYLKENEIGSLAKYFDTFTEKIEMVISHVKTTSTQLADASNEISDNAQKVSCSVQTQHTSFNELASSIKDVANNCHSLSDESHRAVVTANQGNDSVKNSIDNMKQITRSSEQISEIFTNIISGVENTSASIDQINNATDNQSASIDKISEATKNNTSSSENLVASSEELAAQADSLKELVGTFKVHTEIES